jgi:hypothetical protein
MSARSLFEVHTLKGGQWIIDSTYPDKDSAIEVAKQLYGEKRFQGVKVIKDTYDPKTGQGKEIVVFDTSKAPREKPSIQSAPPVSAPTEAGTTRPSGPGPSVGKASKGNKDISVALKAVMWLVLILIGAAALIFGVRYAGQLIY